MFSLWAFPSWETLATFFSRKVAWGSSIMIISNVGGPFSESSFNRLTPLKINSWNLRHYQSHTIHVWYIYLHLVDFIKGTKAQEEWCLFSFPPVMKKTFTTHPWKVRTLVEGSTVVMQAINTNIEKNLKKVRVRWWILRWFLGCFWWL